MNKEELKLTLDNLYDAALEAHGLCDEFWEGTSDDMRGLLNLSEETSQYFTAIRHNIRLMKKALED